MTMTTDNKLFLDFLDERKSQVLTEVQDLAAQDRTDESNVLKAKANIYDIAKAVFEQTAKKASEDALKAGFSSTFGNITGMWKKSLEQAKAHNDSYKILIEEAKFEAVSEILAKLDKLF